MKHFGSTEMEVIVLLRIFILLYCVCMCRDTRKVIRDIPYILHMCIVCLFKLYNVNTKCKFNLTIVKHFLIFDIEDFVLRLTYVQIALHKYNIDHDILNL